MTRVQAIGIIVAQAQSDRITISGYRELRKALLALDLTPVESEEVERLLEYRNSLGKLHAKLAKRRKETE